MNKTTQKKGEKNVLALSKVWAEVLLTRAQKP